MTYDALADQLVTQHGADRSTMMGSPCLRYKGEFFTMMFDKARSLIVKLPADRVSELIAAGTGNEFNYTKKRFKEWLLVSADKRDHYEVLMHEALDYAKSKTQKHS